MKDLSYQHEREYRYLFGKDNMTLDDPFILDLGSLHGISVVMSLDELLETISIKFAEEPDVYHRIEMR